jgi:hypothetical protein
MRSKYSVQGYNLGPIVEDIRIAVSQVAAGNLRFDLPGQRPQTKMYAPSFRRGVKPEGSTEAQAFTSAAIAQHLGMAKKNRGSKRAASSVEVACRLLELLELGALDEATLAEVCDGKWTLSDLRKLFPFSGLSEARETAAASAAFSNPFLT